MNLEPVKNPDSHVEACSYDMAESIVTVRFKNNPVIYQYKGQDKEITLEDYEAFRDAEHPGKALSIIKAKCPNPAKLTPAGAGFVVEQNKIESRYQGYGPDYCPACGTRAKGFIKPSDPRFNERIQTLKDMAKGTSDDDGIKEHLRLEGGYIEHCEVCGTDFFVKASAARIRE